MGVGFLLDTHAAAWWWLGDDRLPEAAREAIADKTNQVFVSAVTVWEMANKHRVGKWPEAERLVLGFEPLLVDAGFKSLPITANHARVAGRLQGPHRDPFDRMLAAQSMAEALVMVSTDPVFAAFGARVLWSEPLP